MAKHKVPGEPRLERVIGVVYRPQTERHSHYFYARLPQQFDAIIHFDETTAVTPLELTPIWERGEAPETSQPACEQRRMKNEW